MCVCKDQRRVEGRYGGRKRRGWRNSFWDEMMVNLLQSDTRSQVPDLADKSYLPVEARKVVEVRELACGTRVLSGPGTGSQYPW